MTLAASRQPQTAWRVVSSIDAVPLLLLLLQSDLYGSRATIDGKSIDEPQQYPNEW